MHAIALLLLLAHGASARSVEERALDALGPTPSADHVREIDQVLTWAAGTRVRFRQTVRGIPVEGGEVFVSLTGGGDVRHTRGPVDLSVDLDIEPKVSAEAAEASAGTVAALFGTGALWEPRSELRVWVDRDGSTHLVWAVDVASAEPARTWRVLVDAHDGTILRSKPTSFDALGRVYPTNPRESDAIEVELPNLDESGTLSGTFATVVSCENWEQSGYGGGMCRDVGRHAVPDANGDYLFNMDPDSFDDPLAEVMMYYHLDLMSQWMDTALDFRHPRPIQGIVNFAYDNAFFGDADGDGFEEVAFGQVGNMDFAYDADVIYHEFMHSVIGHVADLGFAGADEYGITYAPQGLNEGSADVFSMVLTGDPRLGAYAGAAFGTSAIRELGPDRRCPDDLYGESHEDGMIWGAMAWNMIDDPLIGPDVTAQVFYGSILEWPSDVSFAIAGDLLLAAADAMLADGVIDAATREAIGEHAAEANVPGCERVINLNDGTRPRLAASLFGDELPVTAQYSIQVPITATEARLRIREWYATDGMGWKVYVRRGKHIEYEVERNAFGFELPVAVGFDFEVQGRAEDSVVLDATTDPPLVPGATYYFSLASRSIGNNGPGYGWGEVTVGGTITLPEPGEGAPVEETPAGCGCSSGVPATGGLALVALLVARRRAR